MKKVLFALYLLLLCLGIEDTFFSLSINEGTYIAYILSISSSFLILLYFVPFLFGVKILNNQLNTDQKVFIGSFVSGFFISGSICAITNQLLDDFWISILPESIYNDWTNALTSPFSEELVKGAICLLFIYLMNLKEKKDYFISGIGIGIGFQVIEDITYIFPQIMSNDALNNIIPNAFSRISTFISSHWAYSAIFMVGVYVLFKEKNITKGIIYITLSIFLHFLWNSPIEIPTPIISTIILLVFIKVLKEVFSDELVQRIDSLPPL